MNRAEKLIELYEPFILHNDHVFECETPACCRPRFHPRKTALFDRPEAIDWWDYWINVHIPALRRWCYPLMEGRPLESRTAARIGLDRRARSRRAFEFRRSTRPLWRSS